MKIKEIISTITSLVYILAAVLIALTTGNFPFMITSLVVLGVFSLLFHWNESETDTPAHRGDEGSIYAVITVLLYHAWGSIDLLLIPLAIALGIVLFKLKTANLVKITVGVAILIFAGLAINVNLSTALAIGGLAALAGGVRLLSDKTNLTDLLHGIWHILIAAAVYLTWAFSNNLI